MLESHSEASLASLISVTLQPAKYCLDQIICLYTLQQQPILVLYFHVTRAVSSTVSGFGILNCQQMSTSSQVDVFSAVRRCWLCEQARMPSLRCRTIKVKM